MSFNKILTSLFLTHASRIPSGERPLFRAVPPVHVCQSLVEGVLSDPFVS